jgi:hypothetical protein
MYVLNLFVDCKINSISCPISDGYTYVDHLCMCYKYIAIQSVHASAVQYCVEDGGYLVKLDRLLKHLEIEQFLGNAIVLYYYCFIFINLIYVSL